MSKCHSCKLRYVCEESAEWACTHNGYRGYMPEDSVEYSSNAVEKVIEAWNRRAGNMAEYIERKTVIDLITRRYENPEICTQEINSIPAADVAPVTRCKDCKYAYINSFAVSSGEALCTLSGKPMQQDDFCSYGDPKEGNHA